MKDFSFSIAAVVALALLLALLFRWIYPLVEISGELALLFVFVASILKLAAGKLFAQFRKPGAGPATPEPGPEPAPEAQSPAEPKR